MSRNNLKPLSEVMNELKGRGYKKDFIYQNNKLRTMDSETTYDHDELTIIDEYRFEGDSDPGMMAILYTLETKDGIKGTISNGYGTHSDKDMDLFMQKVKEVGRD